jgi:hypothetical protein
MRGRHRIAKADSAVSPSHRAPFQSASDTGEASIRASMSDGPSATPQTTKTPTARIAKSFTMASSAMAETSPGCRSFRSSDRVPKTMVKSASPPATQIAVCSVSGATSAPGRAKTSKLSVTDCSCSAI